MIVQRPLVIVHVAGIGRKGKQLLRKLQHVIRVARLGRIGAQVLRYFVDRRKTFEIAVTAIGVRMMLYVCQK